MVAKEVSRSLEEILSEELLTKSQKSVLEYIRKNDKSVKSSDIEDNVPYSQRTVRSALQVLNKNGFIEESLYLADLRIKKYKPRVNE